MEAEVGSTASESRPAKTQGRRYFCAIVQAWSVSLGLHEAPRPRCRECMDADPKWGCPQLVRFINTHRSWKWESKSLH